MLETAPVIQPVTMTGICWVVTNQVSTWAAETVRGHGGGGDQTALETRDEVFGLGGAVDEELDEDNVYHADGSRLGWGGEAAVDAAQNDDGIEQGRGWP